MGIIEVLCIVLFTSLFVIGTYEVTRKGEPLHFVRRFLDRFFTDKQNNPSIFYYPILHCPMCMSSLYGTTIFVVYKNWNYIKLINDNIEYFVIIPIVICCYGFISIVYDTISK